ncbi:MAG TPA: exopolysaccharide biosynthesis polyprenyl glycosylphosphotransferase [Actinomycetota bacterium]|nr:exopolysaccharide biosynthesis polyprenyl glycosylphosphotransferase [Actinomycetota bacterium]
MSQSVEHEPGAPGIRVTDSAGEVTVIREVLESDGVTAVGNAAAPGNDGRRRNRFFLLFAMACTDALSLVAAAALAGISVSGDRTFADERWLLIGTSIGLWLAILGAFRLYSAERMPVGEQGKRIVAAAGVATATSLVLAGGELPFTPDGNFGWLLLLLICAELVTRSLWAWAADALRRRGRLGLRTLVIGGGEEVPDLAHVLSRSDSDLVPIGRVSVDGDAEILDGLPHLGHLRSLPASIGHHDADCLLIASRSLTGVDHAWIRRLVRREGLRLRFLAPAPDALASRLTVVPVGSLVAVGVRPARLSGLQAGLKRVVDLTGAAVALLAAAPLMACVAIMVRATSPGPILFRQERVTKGGRSFTILKFRTMIHEVDRVIAERSLDPTVPYFKHVGGGLLTPIGGFLRRFSLDELPQLWNVIRGDMSLVGPRPLPIEQVAANPELLGPRHDVRAGITGWWQINGRSEVTAEEAVRHDLFYIENWSLGLDLSIMVRTIGVLLHTRGAR